MESHYISVSISQYYLNAEHRKQGMLTQNPPVIQSLTHCYPNCSQVRSHKINRQSTVCLYSYIL